MNQTNSRTLDLPQALHDTPIEHIFVDGHVLRDVERVLDHTGLWGFSYSSSDRHTVLVPLSAVSRIVLAKGL